MINPSVHPGISGRKFAALFASFVLCWLVAMVVNLYFFSYPSMDSWTLTAPAATAKIPLVLKAPFLGSFEGADKAWGLHWPGGLMLTSLVTPFLPHSPATYVCIAVFYWLLASMAAAFLVNRLTGSRWLAFYAFVFVATDRLCSSIAWFQRYELLGGAIAVTGIMMLCRPQNERSKSQLMAIAGTFFLMPMVHPVYWGLGLGLAVYLGFHTFVLKRAWERFWYAAIGYAAGWIAFFTYYRSRPWLYAQFRNHADQNLEITRDTAPPGIRTFLLHLYQTDQPTRAGLLIYLIAFGVIIVLARSLWQSRRHWREFLSRHELTIFLSLGLVGSLGLCQTTYNPYYWVTAWPFAVALACLAIHRAIEWLPQHRRTLIAAAVILMLLHGSYWAGRTYLWYGTGWANMRSITRNFAESLPRGGRLFIPESLWDIYAGDTDNVYLNSLPFSAGTPTQKRYAAYVAGLIRPGDVLVTDTLQSHPCLIEMSPAQWKQIGQCKLVYMGADKLHGFDLTAYQRL